MAQTQGGFFTTRQAREAGFEDNVHSHHVRSGNWVRERRGVYRLAQFPLPARPDLIVWQLWSRNRDDQPQGVFSHATALTLHALSDAMPAKLDMTVPPGFQRMAAIPEVLRIHRARLGSRDVETVDGVRVTTPLRTLIDTIVEGQLALELQAQAVEEALRRGLVRRRQLEEAAVSTRARQRINKVLSQVPDGPSTPTRSSSSRRGQRSAKTSGGAGAVTTRGRRDDGSDLRVIPASFESKYPHLSNALVGMKAAICEDIPPEAATKELIASEIVDANREGALLGPFIERLFGGLPRPDDAFMNFSMKAYRHLDVSDDVRLFMGRLWTDVLRSWDGVERAQFLLTTVRDPHEVFQALDFAVEVFRRIEFKADEVLPWLLRARQRVSGDYIQHGFWACVEAFCTNAPREAVALADTWLSHKPDPPSLNLIGNIIGWLRLAIGPDHPAAAAFSVLESRVQTASDPAWRAIYIQSWAQTVGHSSMTEAKALELRDQLVHPDEDEEVAWCFLLSAIAKSDRRAWPWTHRELKRVARPQLSEQARYWAVEAALHGLDTAGSDEAISAINWTDILVALLPVPATSVGTWRRIQHSLVTLADKQPIAARRLITTLAEHSGATWFDVLKDREFAWLTTVLREKGLHTAVSGELCFGAGAPSRRLGLLFFEECGVDQLDASVVSDTTAIQMELLLLEAQRRLVKYEALGRLHACLARDVDRLGGSLPELFYDEVALQALNTHGYRATLAAKAADHEYLAAILEDVEERLTAIHKASESPALQMEVPGQARADRLHGQRMARDVAKGIKEHSTFLSFMPTVHLLYGGTAWRTFTQEQSLSDVSGMHASSASFEIPRLEFSDPEGMHLRRLMASIRIATLERSESEDGKQ